MIELQQIIQMAVGVGIVYLFVKHFWDAFQERKKFKDANLIIDEIERLLLKASKTEDEEEKEKIKQEIFSKLDDYKL